MKKGTVNTCNGCLAFEESVRLCPPGSPAALTNYPAFCGIGISIEKKGESKTDYRPKCGTCPKPKNITDLIKEKTIFYEKCHAETVR